MKSNLFVFPGRVLAGSILLASVAPSQEVTFSVDWKGQSIARPDSVTGIPITEGDVLGFGPGAPGFGALPAPRILFTGGDLGLLQYNNCVGHPPGTPCGVELDAISRGLEPFLIDGPLPGEMNFWFTVDEWAEGEAGAGPGPTVFTEGGAIGDASADLFVEYGLPPGPLPPGGPAGFHVGVLDGNGQPSAPPLNSLYPGIGLVEPNHAAPGAPNNGDNLDAIDVHPAGAPRTDGIYFSLDAGFGDPLEGLSNSGSAALQGFFGGDVLFTASPGTAPVLYASALDLGLDLAGGPGSDDLDALILAENGNGVFDPSQVPYDWQGGLRNPTDMLLFSVRRGSAVIGAPDSIFGIPIEAGDILTTPLAGGVSQFPGIMYAAETLGLRTTRTHGAQEGDELAGADILPEPWFDCNHNGVEDSVDIATGGSLDTDNNGIPDECEAITEKCQCPAGSAPCGNPDDNAGCANSTGVGGHFYFQGTHGVGADDLVLTGEKLPVNQFGVIFMGGGHNQFPFGDGLRCVVAGGVGLFRYAVTSSGGSGEISIGPGIAALSATRFPAAGWISSGSTWYFQCWHRDPAGPCGNDFNVSNSIQVDFGL